MKKLVLLSGLVLGMSFLMPVKVQAQQCPNLNFGSGTFSRWQAYMGSCGSGVQINPSPATAGRHTIMDAQSLIMTGQMFDERCNTIKKVPDGFNYAAKLGNEAIGAEMEALSYTMTIDSTNSLLILHFAWVMEDPSHSLSDQPQFTMTIKDSLGRPMTNVKCGNNNFIAQQGMDGLACNTSTLVARNWTTVGFSLEPYMGRTIMIYFETRDCTLSGHYGYAYLVGECRPMTIDLQYCDGQTAARLRAPEGFKRYKWTRSSQKNWVREGEGRNFQNIVVSDPVDGEEFKCEVTSALKEECNAEMRTIIAKTSIAADFFYGVKDARNHVDFIGHGLKSWYDTCTRTATLVDNSYITNSKKDHIEWEILDAKTKAPIGFSQDSMYTFTFPDPPTNEPVKYLIRLSVWAENGCANMSDTIPENFITIFPSPQIEIEGKDQLCLGDTISLKAVAKRSKFVSHTWSYVDVNGMNYNLGTSDSIKIYDYGVYKVESIDSAGCVAIDTHKVTTLRPEITVLRLTHVNCYGEATGIISHGAITGGQSPYKSFKWTLLEADGSTRIDSTTSIVYSGALYMDRPAGIYIFEAIDARDCYLYGEVEILQNDSLRIAGVEFPTTCGDDNGKLKLTAMGGVPPYQYKVNRADGTPVRTLSPTDSVTGLSVGLYLITVVDNLDCETVDTISVTATPIPYLELTKTTWETCESENGSAWVTAVDARFPVKYTWSTGREADTVNMIGHLKTGTYTVEMVDDNGCRANINLFVDEFPSPIISVVKTPETCGREDGTVSITINSPDSTIIRYEWIFGTDTTRWEGGSTASLTGLKAGTYKLIVSSKSIKVGYNDSCMATQTITIEHVDGPIARFEANSYSVPSNTIFTLTDVSHGTVQEWKWDMGDGNHQTGKIVYYTYPASGDYIVLLEVIDENKCTDTISKVIHIYEELNVFIPNMFTPNGDGVNEKWKPKMSEYSKEGYQLSIFDRWGQLIFRTLDTEEEWDGKVSGKYAAPNTVFSYRVVVRDFTGQEYEFVGTVTIIK